MSGGRLIWSILNKPLLAAVIVSGLMALRLLFGMDGIAAFLTGVLLLLPLVLLRIRYNRVAGKARLRDLMVQKLAEPVWASVLREVLSALILVVGSAFVSSEGATLDLWILSRSVAEVFLLGAPLIIALFVAFAYSERRSAAKWLAREAEAGTP